MFISNTVPAVKKVNILLTTLKKKNWSKITTLVFHSTKPLVVVIWMVGLNLSAEKCYLVNLKGGFALI